jgi:hypothetical protein
LRLHMLHLVLDGLKLELQRWMAKRVRHRPSTPRRTLSDTGSLDGARFDHSLWDAVLREHVRERQILNGIATATVDYDGVSRDARFDAYLTALADADIEALAPAEQLALLINAYNAFCIGLIVDAERAGRRVASVTALSGGTRGVSVWNLPAGVLGGRHFSLGELEHRELRGRWDEPAVHFCIVCASASCPDLRRGAYVGAGLQAQMAARAAAFAANRTKGLAWDGATLTLSRILFWFADDWGGPQAAARCAVEAMRSASPDLAAAIVEAWDAAPPRRRAPKLRYFPYSWALNRALPESGEGVL